MSVCLGCEGLLTRFGDRQGYLYAVCGSCGTLQLDPMPSAESIREAYTSQYASAGHSLEFGDPALWKKTSDPYHRCIVRAVKDYAVRGPILDFGAGWGFLTESLIAEGSACRGFELSETMLAFARGRGLPVERGNIADIGGLAGKIDAIVMSGVFEHLSEPDRFLAQASSALPTGGFIFSFQPTARFFRTFGRMAMVLSRSNKLPGLYGGFAPPWHTILYSLDGFRSLCRRHGFEVIDVRPGPQGRALGMTGVVQRALEWINLIGWIAGGEQWPLLTSHLFVIRKKAVEGAAV